MSSSYNTPCSKHKLVVHIYSTTETSLAMSTLAIWCRVVQSHDVPTIFFGLTMSAPPPPSLRVRRVLNGVYVVRVVQLNLWHKTRRRSIANWFAVSVDSLVKKYSSAVAGAMCGMYALVFCYTLMTFCSWLRPYPPCNSYCMSVIKNCSAYMSINVNESVCMRIGARFNINCSRVGDLNGGEITLE